MSYFGEKSHQLSTGSLEAFGISLCSRYAKADEMIQMLSFAELVAQQGLHHLVSEAFYDSGSCCCTFTLKPDVDPLSAVGEQIKECALATIGQFDWEGSVLHGNAAA